MVQTFYINLDRHPERRCFLEAEFARIGWRAERISAYDGRSRNIPSFAMPFFSGSDHLSALQIACSISHMQVWRLIIERNIDAALVLEDDARLANDLPGIIDDVVAQLPSDWDIVRLCRASKRAVKPVGMVRGGRTLVRYSRVPLGRAGYLVSRAGASKLLTPRRVVRPGDVEIAHPWLLGLNIYGVEHPPIVQERTALPSSIGSQRGDISDIRRAAPSLRRLLFNCRQLGPVWWARCWLENTVGRHLRLLALQSPIYLVLS